MRKLLPMLAAALIAGGMFAAETGDQEDDRPPQENRGGRRGGNGPGRRGGPGMMMMTNRSNAESAIRAKYTAEYDAILKEMTAAEEKMAALAKKAQVELPTDMNAELRKIRAKFPAEYLEAEKAMTEDFRSGMQKMRALAEKAGAKLGFNMRGRGMRGGMGMRGEQRSGEDAPPPRESPAEMIRRLEKLYPEEMKRYYALREDGKRREARELLRELAEKARQQNATQGKSEEK